MGVQSKETLEEEARPSGESTPTSSQGLWPLEKNQSSLEKNSKSLKKVKVPELKTNEEHAKELTLGQDMGVRRPSVEPSQREGASCRGRTENQRSSARGCDNENIEDGTSGKYQSTH